MTSKRRPSWRQGCIAAAKALTQERRQEFLDAMRHGGKDLGATREAFGLTLAEAVGIIEMNLVKKTTITIRRQSK